MHNASKWTSRRPVMAQNLLKGLAATVLVVGCQTQAPTTTTGQRGANSTPAPAAATDAAGQAQLSQLQSKLDSDKSALATANGQITQLQASLASGATPTQLGQTGVLYSGTSPTSASIDKTWDTKSSIAAGLSLLATASVSGATAAWTPTANQIVYFSSATSGGTVGVQAIDASTYTAIATQYFDLRNSSVVPSGSPAQVSAMASPAGIAASPDGTQLFVPTGDTATGAGRILVIDAKSLRVTQVIGTSSLPGKIKSFVDSAGKQRVLVELGGNGYVVLDPTSWNQVVTWVNQNTLHGGSYEAYAEPSGKYIYADSRSVVSSIMDNSAFVRLNETADFSGGSGFANPAAAFLAPGLRLPAGLAFSALGGFAYGLDNYTGLVRPWTVASNSSGQAITTGIAGPMHVALSRDNTRLFITGQGGMLGVVSATPSLSTLVPVQISGGQAIDDVIPSPVTADELWISSPGANQTIVVNAAGSQPAVKQAIAGAGAVHGGAFVKYQTNYTGAVQADQGGVWDALLAAEQAAATQSAMP